MSSLQSENDFLGVPVNGPKAVYLSQFLTLKAVAGSDKAMGTRDHC